MSGSAGREFVDANVALKSAGRPFDDEEIWQVTWDVWMKKDTWAVPR